MFPEIEIGSRPSGFCWVLLLRVVVQGVLGSTKTKMAGQRNSGAAGRGSGAAEQRGSGAAWQRGSVAAGQWGNGTFEQQQDGCVGQHTMWQGCG